ncbi:sensor histidine kinase [Granulicella arctica]|uniref:histidine kinase n=1 Tax=Granulicella arctica TaxID=940613 RepID=A0A7Y9PLC8_9BACT|nr:ATP-binding protein [Granulicella arctica]NYF81168.1 PAS domain S-box-containing protein [Granulicella arctica]
MDILSIYTRTNRNLLLLAAATLVVTIAFTDWSTKPYISIGFLYLFPIMLISGILARWQIMSAALVCSVLQEAFSNLPSSEAIVRLILSSAGFVGTGFLVFELVRNRRIVMQHLEEVEGQVRLRKDAEEQLRVLVESSPAAILTVDSKGEILLANLAAQEILAPGQGELKSQAIQKYLPALLIAARSRKAHPFRTTMQCCGQRADGETFLAGIWFSTYTTQSGNRLAAIIVDLSEELVHREDLSLDYLLKNARILMSAVSHEIRNLSGTARVMYENLDRLGILCGNEDFEALGTLIHGMERLSDLDIVRSSDKGRQAVELGPVLDEVRILIESACRESEVELFWKIEGTQSVVWADRYGLIQVFLNLAKNSLRAMEDCSDRHLTVEATRDNEYFIVRIHDTGPGIANSQDLFRPFQQGADSSGLGLYVSQSIMKSFGGDLAFEPRDRGCCFAITIQVAA